MRLSDMQDASLFLDVAPRTFPHARRADHTRRGRKGSSACSTSSRPPPTRSCAKLSSR